jgi:hypothetical protein
LNYRDVISRILDNLHIDDENGAVLKKIKNDIEDVIISAFGLSDQPRKEVLFTLTKTEDRIIKFDNGVLPTNLSINGFKCSGDALKYDIASGSIAEIGTILHTNLRRVNTFSIDIWRGAFTGSTITLTGEVLDKNGVVLFTKTVEVPTTQTTITFEPYLIGVDLQVKFTTNTTVAPTIDMVVTADNFIININSNEVELPNDFYIPHEVVFEDSESKRILTKEMSRSQYVSWSPNRIYTDSLPFKVTDPVASLIRTHYTDESQDYDGSLGYLFQVKEGKTYFLFKPNVTGTLTISYSHIPNVVVNATDSLQINRRFSDLVVYGATLKELTRRLTKPNIKELEFAGVQSSIGLYRKEYKELLHLFTNFANKRSESAKILPFSLINDNDMIIQ